MTADLPGAVLINATWVNVGAWFWSCRGCVCAFGPLTDKATAQAGADEHDRESGHGLSVPVLPGVQRSEQ